VADPNTSQYERNHRSIEECFSLSNSRKFVVYREQCKPTTASLPSICPNAHPEPPVSRWPHADMLTAIEERFHAQKLIPMDHSIHWVGDEESEETTCRCDLSILDPTKRPAEWEPLQELRRAIHTMVLHVRKHAYRQVSPQFLELLRTIGVRVVGLTCGLAIALPQFPLFPLDQKFQLWRPASVPVIQLQDNSTLVASEDDIRVWQTNLHKLLTNIVYPGKIRYKTEIHDGEHAAIVDTAVWQRVQALLQRNGRSGGATVRNQFGALLKGLLRCVPCGCAMTPSYTTKNASRVYRYYVCSNAQKRGWNTCPSKSIPAGEIERFVVEQIKWIGKDPAILNETFAQTREQASVRIEALETEKSGLERELVRANAEVRTVIQQASASNNAPNLGRLADLQERIRENKRRTAEIDEQMATLRSELVDEREVALALSAFDLLWASLTPREQARIVELLVQRVDFNGATNKVSITFHPTGIKTLVDELNKQHKHKEKSA
jgi:Recombinase zinc beta ribbon domain